MKIAAALGVWPFCGWKIINHGGWFTQVKGRSWQKKRSSLYRSCLHERVILPDYRITSLLQFIHHFYNTFTSLLHHSFSIYITFTTLLHHFYIICTSLLHHSFSSYVTSILCAICTSPPFLNVLTAGFPAAPARSLSYAINCAPVHRFLLALVQILSHPAWIQAKIARESVRCIVMHRAENLSARFWRVFGEKMGLFMAQATETTWGPLRRCW